MKRILLILLCFSSIASAQTMKVAVKQIRGLQDSLNAHADTANTLTFKGDIPGTANLNNYTTTGIYNQGVNAQAASGSNYPAPYAGKLEVVNAAGNILYQTYHVYVEYEAYYTRSYISYIGWGSWKRVWTNTDFTSTDIANWNTAYGWGNPAGVYELLSNKATSLASPNNTKYPTTQAVATAISGFISGNQSISFTGSGDVTGSASGTTALSPTLTIANNAVTNAKAADMATQTFKGRTTAGTGDPEDLTITQAQTLLGISGTNTGDQTITLTGDITGSGTGSFATAIAAGAIVNADINASAAIAHSKMAALTAGRAMVTDGSGVASAATTTAAEIGYVNGVTSAIQTQLNGKQASLTGPGFVKATGGVISYDNSTYLTTEVDGSTTNEIQNLGLGTTTSTTQPLTISSGTGATLPAATTSLAGLLTAADKTKLDGIATGATVANNGTLTMVTAGVLSGSASFTANQSGNSTFTVTAPAYGTTSGTIAQGNDSRFHNAVTIGTANGLSLSTQALSLAAANTSTTGALTSTDWNTFNNKFTLPSLTAGSVLFSNGSTISQDNSNFFWDNTNKRLGVGVGAPESIIHVKSSSPGKPGGVNAAPITAMKISRASSPGFSYPESAEFRIGHGGPSVYGSNLDLYVNGDANTTDIPDKHVMTWAYSGNVGLGTTSPIVALHIVNAGEATALLRSTSSSLYAGFLLRDYTDANVGFVQYGNPSAAAFTNEVAVGSGNSSTALKFYQGGTSSGNQRLIFNTSGYAAFPGSVSIGSTSNPAEALDVTGSIKQSAVTSSPVAADASGKLVAGTAYSSGTYTPTVTGGSTYTPTVFTYIRVGNIVTVAGRIAVTAIGSAPTSVAEITLPVATAFTNTSQANGTVSGINLRAIDTNMVTSISSSGKALITFASANDSNATVSVSFQYSIQ